MAEQAANLKVLRIDPKSDGSFTFINVDGETVMRFMDATDMAFMLAVVHNDLIEQRKKNES